MALSILLTILSKLKKIWDQWDVHGGVIFSLKLQILLVLMAPFRKSTRSTFVIRIIWFAYVLADAVPNFVLGLITNSQRNQANKAEQKGDMFAFWAPFLLLHMGGPDTITAFALEDNELWPRQLFSLGVQAVAVIYVFIQSFPNENLWIPTLLMVVAGLIKYLERIRALHLASLDKIRFSTIRDPYPGPNYAKLMKEYAFKKAAGIPTEIVLTQPPENKDNASASLGKQGQLNSLEVVHYAYRYFQKFKGLVADLILSSHDRENSRAFFNMRTAEDALKVMEVELNFLYGTFYTKEETAHSAAGCSFRLLAFGSILATLGFFHFKTEKDEFSGVDVEITYILLLGAIALDIMAFLRLISSDRTSALKNPEKRSPMASVVGTFLSLKEPQWQSCNCSNVDQQHKLLATPFSFRRWSGSISGLNFIRCCLGSNTQRIHEFPSKCRVMFKKIFGCRRSNTQRIHIRCTSESFRHIKEKVSKFFFFFIKIITYPIGDIVYPMLMEMKYVSDEPFTRELWEFIFDEIKTKSEMVDTMNTARMVFAARGEVALTWPDTSVDCSKIMKYVIDFTYDESILIWHIATDLCYHTITDEDPELQNNDRLLCKILSDYMLYLLVFQPAMLSSSAGMGALTFQDTYAEADRFFRGSFGPNEDKEACKATLSVNTDIDPTETKGHSKSVLFDASILARELKRMEREEKLDKWKLMSKVWVEMLSYAASHCRATAHAAQLSKGGELLTFIWLLMAHFGITEQLQYIQGDSRAKLIVRK